MSITILQGRNVEETQKVYLHSYSLANILFLLFTVFNLFVRKTNEASN